MQRSVAVALVVIALGAAAVSWWLLAGDSRGDAEGRPGQDGGAGQQPATLEGANERPGRRVETDSFAGRASAPDASPAEEGLLLEVVERDTGLPVPHAFVYFVRPSDLTGDQMRGLRGSSPDAIFLRFGERLVADERGRTEIPRSAVPWRVAGAWGTLWGTLSSGAAAPYRLELSPVPAVSVLVEDEAGQPVRGVQVALVHVRRSRDRELAVATTDRDGFAVLRYLQSLWPVLRGGRTVVTFAFPLAGAPEPVVDLASPPRDPVRLVLPRTGSVAVKVRDVRGDPLQLPGRVSLAALERKVSPRSRLPGGALALPSRPLESGGAVFDHVGVGLELEVVVHGEDFPTLRQARAGPRLPGDRVQVELTVGRLHPLIFGRALDSAGRGLAQTSLQLRLQCIGPASTSSTTQQLVTDARGVFAVAAREPLEEPGEWILSLSHGEAGGRSAVRRTIPAPLPEEGVDLGELRLVISPILVSGVVVSDEGVPLPDVSVWVGARRAGAGGQDSLWEIHPELAADTDPEGRFEIFGTVESVESRLHARSQDFIQESSMPFTPGARGVRIVLHRTADARGGLLVSKDLVLASLRASLETDGSRSFLARMERRAGDRVALTWNALPPGTYDLSVRTRDLPTPVLSVPRVVLRPGEVSEDPRLAEMDLRGLLRPAKLTVVDEQDRPIAGATLAVSRAGSGTEARLKTDTRGVAAVVLTADAATISAWAPGFRVAGPQPIEGDARIVLLAGLPVRIALGGFAVGAAPQIDLQLVLSFEDPSADPELRGWRSSRRRGFVDRFGEATLTVPTPGRYQVTLIGTRTTDGRQRTGSFSNFTPRILDVHESGAQTLHQLTLDQPAFDRWLR